MKLQELCQKYKQVILYLFFGGLTTLLSLFLFWLCREVLGINELIANIISWILCVLFAFYTNRRWVFEAAAGGTGNFLRMLLSFAGGRLTTLAVEEAIIFAGITLLHKNSMLIKLIAQVIVVILNYVISKWFVFKKRD